MRRFLLLFVLFVIQIPAAAQPMGGEAVLAGWPALRGEVDRYPFDLLPSIDTLVLGYEYGIGEGAPVLRFDLAWQPGPFGILNERRVPVSRMPEDMRLERIELLAGVFVDGIRVTDMRIVADSLLLPPMPEAVAFDGTDLEWATLFTDADAEAARAYFDIGFVLDSLEIEHIAFAVFEPRPTGRRYEGPPPPPRVRVYPVHIDIYADWILGGRRIDRINRGTASKAGRPSRSVRGTRSGTPRDSGATGDERDVIREPAERSGDMVAEQDDRTSRSDREGRSRVPGRKKSDDKEDEEEDTSLVPLAIGAAAAVAVVAVAGGTVGYYGNMSDAPVGLASGYVRPGGGILMQAAVNGAVLGAGDGPDRVIAKVTGFYDVFGAPVQPALGAGAVFAAQGDDVRIEPTFSLGLAGNFGPVVLVGAYDVQARGIDLGLAFNFKARRSR